MKTTFITFLLVSFAAPLAAHSAQLTLTDALARRGETSRVLKMV